jgi:hypothetical protein
MLKNILQLVIVTASVSLAVPAAAATYNYTIDSPTQTGTVVTPFMTAESAAQFYNYTNSEANPDDFTLRDDEALFFLHQNTLNGEIGIGLIFDTNNRTSQGNEAASGGGTASVTISGVPAGSSFVVRDDPSEVNLPINGTLSWRWSNGYTDGMALAGSLTDAEWTVLFSAISTTGITDYSFLNADGSRTDLGNLGTGNFSITSSVNPVPLPAGLPFLLTGLAGLLALRRVRRCKTA